MLITALTADLRTRWHLDCECADDLDGWLWHWRQEQTREPTRADYCKECAVKTCPERPKRGYGNGHSNDVALSSVAVRAWRSERGLYQRQLAERAGCGLKKIEALEGSRGVVVRRKLAERLAAALGTSVGELMC